MTKCCKVILRVSHQVKMQMQKLTLDTLCLHFRQMTSHQHDLTHNSWAEGTAGAACMLHTGNSCEVLPEERPLCVTAHARHAFQTNSACESAQQGCDKSMTCFLGVLRMPLTPSSGSKQLIVISNSVRLTVLSRSHLIWKVRGAADAADC